MKTYKSNGMILLAIILLVMVPDFAYAAGDGIVVWRLEAKTGVSENDIDSLSGIISAEVEKQSGLKVISEADIQTILKGEEKKQKCGVENDSCIAEIGAAIGVPEAVAGDLGRVGTIWVLNLRRINVRNADVLKRVSHQMEGDLTALVRIVPKAAAELFDREIKNSTLASTELNTLEKAAYGTFFSGLGLTVFGFVGMSQMKEAKDSGDKGSFDSWKGATIACWTIGGAAMVTGAALWIFDAVQKKNSQSGSEQVSWGVMPQKDGFAASFLVRW